MNLEAVKKLNNSSLLIKTETLVRDERRITIEILECLREVESRMLYAELGFSSLYEFCIKHLRYSEGSTHRRISAMRLLKTLSIEAQATTEQKIKDGSVSITNLSLLHGFLKTEKKEQGKLYSVEEKEELVNSIDHQSKLDVEKKLAIIQPKLISKETSRVLSGELTEIKFIADEKLLAKLKRIREITAHSNPHPSHPELLHRLADDFLSRHDPIEKAKRVIEKQQAKDKNQSSVKPIIEKLTTTPLATKHSVKESRYIPAHIRHRVWLKDGGKCTYENQETHQKCESTYGLEIDHRKPFALGGEHEIKNLRLLCREHNQYSSKKVFG